VTSANSANSANPAYDADRATPRHKTLNLVLTGGGTAGHVWPHFAVADDDTTPLGALIAQGDVRVHYIGSHTGMERDIVRTAAPKWNYIGIHTGKLRRYFSVQNFVDAFRVVKGCFDAFFAIGKVKADVVFSKGGFVSAPVVWAAWLRGVPVVIHESDATPALATKLTLPFAYRALVSFPQTVDLLPAPFRERAIALGIPMRRTLFGADRAQANVHFGLNESLPTLLVFGGSLGAEALNRLVAGALVTLVKRCNVIHIVGKGKTFDPPTAADGANTGHMSGAYRQFEFLQSDMKLAYAAADLALCRAGASSIFELAAARIPMILVPLGMHQSRGDQIVNARLFERQGWAQWVKEEELTSERVASLVEGALGDLPARRTALEAAPSADAAPQVAALLLALMQRHGDALKKGTA